MKKVLYLFAGVNGTGKSALYNSEKYKNIFSFSNNKIFFKNNKSISWAKEAIEIMENNIKINKSGGALW